MRSGTPAVSALGNATGVGFPLAGSDWKNATGVGRALFVPSSRSGILAVSALRNAIGVGFPLAGSDWKNATGVGSALFVPTGRSGTGVYVGYGVWVGLGVGVPVNVREHAVASARSPVTIRIIVLIALQSAESLRILLPGWSRSAVVGSCYQAEAGFGFCWQWSQSGTSSQARRPSDGGSGSLVPSSSRMCLIVRWSP